MPITGLVIGMDPPQPQDAGRCVLDMIAADGRFVIGEAPTPARVPVVLETSTRKESRRLLDWLSELPGVLTVEIAYADFSDSRPPQEQQIDAD